MDREATVKSIMDEQKGIYTPSRYNTEKVYYAHQVKQMIRRALSVKDGKK